MIRRPPRSTLDRSSAASDVYKRQTEPLSEPTTIGPVTPKFLLSAPRSAHSRSAQAIVQTPPWSSSKLQACLLYTSPSPRDRTRSRMPSSACKKKKHKKKKKKTNHTTTNPSMNYVRRKHTTLTQHVQSNTGPHDLATKRYSTTPAP